MTNYEINKLKPRPDKRDREKVEEKKSKWYLRSQRKHISRKQSIFLNGMCKLTNTRPEKPL